MRTRWIGLVGTRVIYQTMNKMEPNIFVALITVDLPHGTFHQAKSFFENHEAEVYSRVISDAIQGYVEVPVIAIKWMVLIQSLPAMIIPLENHKEPTMQEHVDSTLRSLRKMAQYLGDIANTRQK